MSPATCGVVRRPSTWRCGDGSSRARPCTKLRTATVGCIGRRAAPSFEIASASRMTALSGLGIEPCPGSPVVLMRSQAEPFSAVWIG